MVISICETFAPSSSGSVLLELHAHDVARLGAAKIVLFGSIGAVTALDGVGAGDFPFFGLETKDEIILERSITETGPFAIGERVPGAETEESDDQFCFHAEEAAGVHRSVHASSRVEVVIVRPRVWPRPGAALLAARIFMIAKTAIAPAITNRTNPISGR